MLSNNLKIAIRNLLRQKVYSLINIIGLAVGVASCLLILLFIQNEFSYDKFFADQDRIYRMVLERIYPNHSTYYAIIPHSFEEAVKHDLPEVEESTQAFNFQNFSLSYTDEKNEVVQFDEDMVLLVDSAFFRVFSFDLVLGSRENVLTQANEIVVTEDFSKRFFGSADPMGKVLRGAQQEFKVVGVLKDIPDNSHFKFSALVSAETFPFTKQENYTGFDAYTYLKLKPEADPNVLESKIPKLVDTYAAAQIERNLGKSWEDYKKEGNGYRYFLQPLSSIHLDPTNLELQMKAGGNINSVYIMIAVVVLILLIACINFMNLATARSSERAKEVGVRKVMGSVRQQLMSQFLTESTALTVIGVLLALALVSLALPFFNSMMESNLQFVLDFNTLAGLIALTIFVGVLAGIYPAFILSSYSPVIVMRGKFSGSGKGKWIRNGLVVFQFWISIVMMIGTLVILEQMNYMQNISLGFDKEKVLVVERGFNLDANKTTTLVNEVRRLPEVIQAASSFAIPGDEGDFFGIQFQPEGSSEVLTTKSMVIADGLSETLGLELVEGKWFSEDVNDSLSIILNETALGVIGLEDAIGKKLYSNDPRGGDNTQIAFTIIGVVSDFNFISLRDKVTPLVIQSNEFFGGGGQYTLARIKPNQIPSAIKSIENVWKKVAPDQPFKFSFLDQNIDQQYKAERKTGKLFGAFASLAVFVACIGLFALSAYIATLRTKEIGVRKVLGASVTSVMVLLSKDFTRMILLAYILAVPFAWYIMENWWLQNFAYRISIDAWIILLAGGIALLIAWLTVSFQSVKAAMADPVNSLRYE